MQPLKIVGQQILQTLQLYMHGTLMDQGLLHLLVQVLQVRLVETITFM